MVESVIHIFGWLDALVVHRKKKIMVESIINATFWVLCFKNDVFIGRENTDDI